MTFLGAAVDGSAQLPGKSSTFLVSDDRAVQRDLFPLPSCSPLEKPRSVPCCRKVRRRLEKTSHVDQLTEECVVALNSLYSHQPLGPAKTGTFGASMPQVEALKHIRNSVQLMGSPPCDLTGPGAVSQLRAFDGYGEDQCPASIATYVPELLSLPDKGNKSMPLAQLLGDDGGVIVSDFIRSRLLDENEALKNLRECGVKQCYSDPKLRDPRVYSGFIKRLHEADLVDFSVRPGAEKIEAVFVKKKDNRIRMVIDCRRSNAWFAQPDKVHLCTAEALSRICLEDTGSLYIATADLKDAFYHFELPDLLRPYFSMRPVFAGEIGVHSLDGVEVAYNHRIYPRLKVLPMGWNHALWWCQSIHQRIVSRAGAVASNCLEDKAAVPDGRCMHLEYVDNFVVIGTDPEAVQNLADKGVQELRDSGLVVHEEESGSANVSVLGWEFNNAIFRPKSHRVWRVRLAFLHMLCIGKVSGRQLEKVLGHATFLCLGRREALSIFGDIFTFIQKHYHYPHRIWKSVRREIQIFVGICPLIWRNLASPWDPEVVAVDASTWGLGATSTSFSHDEIGELGRFAERWRFQTAQHNKPRVSAFGADVSDAAQDYGAAIWANTDLQASSGLQPLRVVEAKRDKEIFTQVPFETMDKKWKVCGRYKWKRLEPIPVLEARASLFAVKHALRRASSFNKRHLILSDSISAVCALEKGRGRAHKMRRVTQQIGALTLASNTMFSYRWIPSEWNVSDGPSRGSKFPSKPSRRPRSDDSPMDTHGSGPKKGPLETSQVEGQTQTVSSDSETEEKQAGATGNSERCRGSPSSVGGGNLQKTLCGLLGSVHPTHWTDWGPSGRQQRCGQPASRFSGVSFWRGGRSQQSSVHGSSSDFLHATLEGSTHDKATHDPPGFARVEEVRPSTLKAPSALGSSVSDDGALHQIQRDRDGPDDCPLLHPLSQARGGHPSSCDGLHQACRPGQGSVVSGPSPKRGGSQQQDRRIRRDSHVRSRSPHLCAQGRVQGDAIGAKRSEGTHLSTLCHRHEECHGESQLLPSAGSTRTGSPVQTPSRGGQSRLCPEAEAIGRDPTSRPMEELRLRSEVREGRKAPIAPSAVTKEGPQRRSRRRKQHRANFPAPALAVTRALSFAVFLEIFSGCGNLAKAIARETGWCVLTWDILHGPEYDLRSPAKRRMILDWIRSGKILGIHLGTPCESFSRARDVPPGPPPLRSDEFPLGLSGLKPHDALKVWLGNLFMRFSAAVLTLCLKMMVPASMENPQRSRVWLCPPICKILRNKLCFWQVTHYCAWGRVFKKATGFLSVHVQLQRLSLGVCHSSKRGICQHTGNYHQHLCGRSATGQWLTKLAEPYAPTNVYSNS